METTSDGILHRIDVRGENRSSQMLVSVLHSDANHLPHIGADFTVSAKGEPLEITLAENALQRALRIPLGTEVFPVLLVHSVAVVLLPDLLFLPALGSSSTLGIVPGTVMLIGAPCCLGMYGFYFP